LSDMNRYQLAYRIFAAVLLTVIGVRWVVLGLYGEAQPQVWRIGAGLFIVAMGGLGNALTAYRMLRKPANEGRPAGHDDLPSARP
jgi:hypothetical protein